MLLFHFYINSAVMKSTIKPLFPPARERRNFEIYNNNQRFDIEVELDLLLQRAVLLQPRNGS